MPCIIIIPRQTQNKQTLQPTCEENHMSSEKEPFSASVFQTFWNIKGRRLYSICFIVFLTSQKTSSETNCLTESLSYKIIPVHKKWFTQKCFTWKKKDTGPSMLKHILRVYPESPKTIKKIGNFTKDYFLRFGNLNHPKLGTMILIVGSTSRFNK